jgi:cation-transporting ATPase E
MDYKIGLTNEQVKQKIKNGLINTVLEDVTKSNFDIIKDNVFTLFNALNFVIGIALLAVGAISNMFYLVIIIMNILIGVIQEIHARNLVEELSLISAIKTKVIREGEVREVRVEEIVQDDIMLLEMGDQISADAYIVNNEIEVNESLLTGEADVIVKKKNDFLYSGSFVIGGKAYARVENVGESNFASKIVAEVKQYKRVHSELIDAIAKVSKFTSYVIVPFGIVLFLQAFIVRDSSMFDAIVNTAAALLGMLPKGLVLLIGISSATGVIKLSKRKVLVQDMHCMETFAHVDVLCLDKTGTITEGNMKVVTVKNFTNVSLDTIMANYVASADDNNATYTALRTYFNTCQEEYHELDKIPFTSERKWGSIHFEEVGYIIVGAPERIVSEDKMPKQVEEAQKDGSRVLLVAQCDTILDKKIEVVTLLGMIVLDDPIRENAVKAFHYFKREGIEVKVISGDNPITVSNVARKAGLETHGSYIDLSKITADEELYTLVKNYSVFGRVSPNQKRVLVKALQKQGHTVAMTGDGVNDVLALREADCSIAMAEGNAAAKQISKLVLLNSDFSTLPDVLLEGRRIINNITKVSSIFFIKTIYSIILSVICIALNIPFPFIPIQITVIDLAIEGYPSFFLSFESNGNKVHGSFLNKALRSALPNSLLVILNIIVIMTLSLTTNQQLTLMYSMVGFISILAVLKACLPFNKLRIFLFFSVAIGFVVALFLFQGLLHINLNDTAIVGYLGALQGITLVLWLGIQVYLYKRKSKKRISIL